MLRKSIHDVEYEDEDKEEELDTVFPLLEIEKQFYDDEGNRIGDEEEEE